MHGGVRVHGLFGNARVEECGVVFLTTRARDAT